MSKLVALTAALLLLGTGIAALRFIDLWSGLAAVLPGFDNVRNPRIVANGAHLAACVLAGFGCAALPSRHKTIMALGILSLIIYRACSYC